MPVVLFRSRLREGLLAEYHEMAAKMLDLASGMPGFISFKSFAADDGERLSFIEFETHETLLAWRDHPKHKTAQRLGRARYYSEFRIQVLDVTREYAFTFTDSQRE